MNPLNAAIYTKICISGTDKKNMEQDTPHYQLKKLPLMSVSLGCMKKLCIIAGSNGAGKTTASYTILPGILDCKEFVNADEIAKGISPFQPEKAGIEADRLMLTRIKKLLEPGKSFAFETTLSTRS